MLDSVLHGQTANDTMSTRKEFRRISATAARSESLPCEPQRPQSEAVPGWTKLFEHMSLKGARDVTTTRAICAN
jgi:hypothetical protein